MITDDEVMQLFAQADPARASDIAPRVDAAGYLDALRTRSTDMTLVENPPRRSDPNARGHRWLLMGAAAAVVLIVLGTLVVANRDDSTGVVTDQTPVATSAPPAPAPAAAPTEAERVAANFLAAYDAFDADAVAAALAPGADVSGLWYPPDWRLGLRFMQVTGFDKFIVGECHEEGSSSAGVLVRCPHGGGALRSSEMGLGPYSGSYMDLTVRDGQIVSTWMHWDDMRNGFSREVWQPFAAWVSSAHPEDAPVMYTDATLARAQVTGQSIPLWEQRTEEYVAVTQAQAAWIAQGARVE